MWGQLVCRLENGLTGILDKDKFGDDEDARRALAATVQVTPHPLLGSVH